MTQLGSDAFDAFGCDTIAFGNGTDAFRKGTDAFGKDTEPGPSRCKNPRRHAAADSAAAAELYRGAQDSFPNAHQRLWGRVAFGCFCGALAPCPFFGSGGLWRSRAFSCSVWVSGAATPVVNPEYISSIHHSMHGLAHHCTCCSSTVRPASACTFDFACAA